MRRRLPHPALGLTLTLALSTRLFAQNNPAQRALDAALHATSAVAIVVDLASGRTLASEHPSEVAYLRTTPGSILKPFFLAAALEDNTVTPQTTVFCRRTLHIGARALECTHPQTDTAFAAQDALAYSCNTYFADLAKRLPAPHIAATLRTYGLPPTPPALSTDAKQLLVLGVSGIAVSPAQMAEAYRRLALHWTNPSGPTEPAFALVHQGLRDSVAFGMAHNAATPNLDLAGKTGTATDPNQPWTHGWFCGAANGIVLVIYLPHASGADAATLAHAFFLAYHPTGPR